MCIYDNTRHHTFGSSRNAKLQLAPFEVAMIVRKLTLIAVVLTSFALAACTSPTAPSQDCTISVGSGCGPK